MFFSLHRVSRLNKLSVRIFFYRIDRFSFESIFGHTSINGRAMFIYVMFSSRVAAALPNRVDLGETEHMGRLDLLPRLKGK